jgi:hypothetical protein
MSIINYSTSARITRFGRNAVIMRGRNEPLDEQALRHGAPTLFAEAKHSSRSERYAHIPTFAVLQALAKEGFDPWEVRVGGSGDEDKRAHTKHLIRLRHRSANALTMVGGAVFEVVLRNSHDGTSRYALAGGFFKMICSNGLMTSEGDMAEFKIAHKGDVVAKVIEGTYSVLDTAPLAIEHVREMEGIHLSQPEQLAYAESAAMLRWPADRETGTSNVPVRPEQILRARRHEDNTDRLWDVFNRAQESLVQGGVYHQQTNAAGRTRAAFTRPVRNIDGNVNLNRALWALTERMRELKSGA